MPSRSTGFWQRLNTLHWALAVSLLLHAAPLTVRFAAPEQFNRVFQDTPLEVILVNSRTQERPEQAQAIAQANLAGGGEAQQGRATSPLPYSALTSIGDELEEAQQRMEQMLAEQTQLLSQVRQQLALLPKAEPQPARQPSQEQQTQEQKRRQLIKLLAEIEKRINEENARPRKRYISPATREAVYAVYYDALRRKIEDKGTSNFPEQNGRKLYGELIMIVTVNHDGQVLETEVVQGSGNRLLDSRAQAIARAAGPFGTFDTAMRSRADQIAVVARFKFTRDQGLETELR